MRSHESESNAAGARLKNRAQSACDSADDSIGNFFSDRRPTRRLCNGGDVGLSVGLRFWQEARADNAAEKLKAMIHVTATVVRVRWRGRYHCGTWCRGHRQIGRWRYDSRRCAAAVCERSVRKPRHSHGESLPVEKFCDRETKEEISPLNSRTPASWDQCREWHGDSSRRHNGSEHLLRQHGTLDHRGSDANELR